MGKFYPDMAMALFAVHPMTTENECLKILKGSHKMDRIDHERIQEVFLLLNCNVLDFTSEMVPKND